LNYYCPGQAVCRRNVLNHRNCFRRYNHGSSWGVRTGGHDVLDLADRYHELVLIRCTNLRPCDGDGICLVKSCAPGALSCPYARICGEPIRSAPTSRQDKLSCSPSGTPLILPLNISFHSLKLPATEPKLPPNLNRNFHLPTLPVIASNSRFASFPGVSQTATLGARDPSSSAACRGCG
jgi:hypothetical protein